MHPFWVTYFPFYSSAIISIYDKLEVHCFIQSKI